MPPKVTTSSTTSSSNTPARKAALAQLNSSMPKIEQELQRLSELELTTAEKAAIEEMIAKSRDVMSSTVNQPTLRELADIEAANKIVEEYQSHHYQAGFSINHETPKVLFSDRISKELPDNAMVDLIDNAMLFERFNFDAQVAKYFLERIIKGKIGHYQWAAPGERVDLSSIKLQIRQNFFNRFYLLILQDTSISEDVRGKALLDLLTVLVQETFVVEPNLAVECIQLLAKYKRADIINSNGETLFQIVTNPAMRLSDRAVGFDSYRDLYLGAFLKHSERTYTVEELESAMILALLQFGSVTEFDGTNENIDAFMAKHTLGKLATKLGQVPNWNNYLLVQNGISWVAVAFASARTETVTNAAWFVTKFQSLGDAIPVIMSEPDMAFKPVFERHVAATRLAEDTLPRRFVNIMRFVGCNLTSTEYFARESGLCADICNSMQKREDLKTLLSNAKFDPEVKSDVMQHIGLNLQEAQHSKNPHYVLLMLMYLESQTIPEELIRQFGSAITHFNNNGIPTKMIQEYLQSFARSYNPLWFGCFQSKLAHDIIWPNPEVEETKKVVDTPDAKQPLLRPAKSLFGG